MGKTIVERLHLRSMKCPQCGARLPAVGHAATVKCEYCDLVSDVVRPQRRSPHRTQPRAAQRAAHWTPQPVTGTRPQVTPTIRPAAVAILASLLVFVFGGGIALLLKARSCVSSVSWESSAPRSQPQANSPTAHPQAPTTRAPTSEGHSQKAKKAKKRKRTRKPDGYKIAKIIKPDLSGCAPRDIMSPRFPVRYTPTVTVTVKSGKFARVSVTVKTSKHDISKLHFTGDRTREVSQSDLDERRKRVARCIKSNIAKRKIPSDSSQRRTAGKVRMSFSHDGVPYGVKNL